MTKTDKIRHLIAEGWTDQKAIMREVGCVRAQIWQVLNPEKRRDWSRLYYARNRHLWRDKQMGKDREAYLARHRENQRRYQERQRELKAALISGEA